jgi:hypothetical protein
MAAIISNFEKDVKYSLVFLRKGHFLTNRNHGFSYLTHGPPFLPGSHL